jgi:hypothetical protein
VPPRVEPALAMVAELPTACVRRLRTISEPADAPAPDMIPTMAAAPTANCATLKRRSTRFTPEVAGLAIDRPVKVVVSAALVVTAAWLETP